MDIFYPAHQETEMKQLLGLMLTMAIGMLPAAGYSTENQSTTEGAGMVNVTLETNKGDIKLELDAGKAPVTVANFLEYARAGHYDNTIFHRVIGGFMIQGGGFDTSMKQKSTKAPVKNEADNGLKNVTGTIAMARTSDPHSATAQFFINVSDNAFLDFKSPTPQGWGYAVFGKVTDGMDVVRSIEKVQTGNKAGHQDVPVTDVIIEKVIIEE
jgi:peptidyl-prolyl cis-trans isomerase B (cyclophilin B)